jgi:hypothetical protein
MGTEKRQADSQHKTEDEGKAKAKERDPEEQFRKAQAED